MANRISVVIDVVADKATRGLTSFRKSVSEADGAVGKFKAGTKSAGQSLKANIMPVAAAAGVAIASFAAKSVQAASNLDESINAIGKTFGDATDAVLEIGEGAAESMGMSQRAFNEAAVSFSSFAKGVAGPGGDVAAVIQDMTQRSADFASVMNLDVAEAARVFQSGLAGETEPLKKFGIDLSAASVEAYALSTGLAASKSEMTEAIKVQARYGLLMERTANTAGDFADTSDGLANSSRIASAQLENFQAKMGEDLLPVAAKAVTILTDVAGAMEGVGLSAAGAEDRIGDGGFAGALTDAINPMQLGIKLWNSGGDALDYVKGTSDDAAEAATNYKFSLDEVYDATKAGTGATVEAAETAEEYKDRLKDNVEALEEIKDAQDEAREATERMREATLESIDASLGYRNQTARTASAIRDANDVLNDSKSKSDDVAQAYRDMEGAALDQAAAAVAMAESQAAANGSTLTAAQRNRTYVNELNNLKNTLTGDAAIAIQMHIDALNRIPRSINTTVGVNSVNRVNSSGTRIGGVAGRNGNVAGATGGIVTRPTMSLIGEAGPEAVIPLNKTPGSSPLPAGIGGGTTNVTINMPASARPDDVENAIKRYDRRQGPM